jgi:hypothetical protein
LAGKKGLLFEKKKQKNYIEPVGALEEVRGPNALACP